MTGRSTLGTLGGLAGVALLAGALAGWVYALAFLIAAAVLYGLAQVFY